MNIRTSLILAGGSCGQKVSKSSASRFRRLNRQAFHRFVAMRRRFVFASVTGAFVLGNLQPPT